MITSILLLVILLALSGFFSSSETAMTSMTKLKVRRLVDENRPRARYMQYWLDDPDGILTTILIGNNIVNIAATTLVAMVAKDELGSRFGDRAAFVGAVAAAFMTVLVLIFGEVVPKTLARRYAEQLSLLLCPILVFLSRILLPLNKALVAISRSVLWISRAPKEDIQPITHAHFRALVDISQEEGLIPSDVAPMFDGLLGLRHASITQLMTPRTEMCWALHDASLNEVLELAATSGYSRIPIVRESPDDVVGILYVKDLMNIDATERVPKPVAGDLVRPAVFLPETRTALDVLRILRSKRVHIGIIVDEYGGVSGVVTMEDIIEAIVGSIHDEHDESLLFSISQEFVVDLNDGRIPARLRDQFQKNGVVLSPDVTVLSEEQDNRWLIADASTPQRYAVRAGEGILNVYDQPTPGLVRLTNGNLYVDARLRLRAISRELRLQLPGDPNMRIGALIQQHFGRLPRKDDEITHGPIVFHVTHMSGIQVDQVEVRVQEQASEDDVDASTEET